VSASLHVGRTCSTDLWDMESLAPDNVSRRLQSGPAGTSPGFRFPSCAAHWPADGPRLRLVRSVTHTDIIIHRAHWISPATSSTSARILGPAQRHAATSARITSCCRPRRACLRSSVGPRNRHDCRLSHPAIRRRPRSIRPLHQRPTPRRAETSR